MTQPDFEELIEKAHGRFLNNHRLIVVANVVGKTPKRDQEQPDSDFSVLKKLNKLPGRWQRLRFHTRF